MQNKSAIPLSRIDVRPHNRRLLLQILRMRGELSRAELAAQSGLSPAAVSNVIAELIESGLVQELAAAPQKKGKLGRPGMLVSLAREKKAVLAVQIGAGVLQVGVCDLEANVLASESSRFALSSTGEQVLASAVGMLKRSIESSGMTMDDVLGIGVGAAGLVDHEQRVNLSSPNLGWTNVAMADYLEDAFDRPAVVDHNVRAMAMGETSYGLGRGLESLAFIYIRTGVGAGLVLGGSAYRGGTHGAVEFGHIRVVPGGKTCNCGGQGCLETVASDQIIKEKVLAAGLIPDSAAASSTAWIDEFIGSVASGNPQAVAIRDELVEHLARALLAVINLLNPQMIVLGGLLADLGDVIVDPLRTVLPPQVLPIIRDGIRIERTSFGAHAGLIGAATVALGHFVFGTPLAFGRRHLAEAG